MNLKTLKDKLFANDIIEKREVRTKDATNNLFSVFRLLGLYVPKSYRLAYIVYSSIINGLVVMYLPWAFTFSYILSSSEMEIGHLLTSFQVSFDVYGCAAKTITMGLLLNKLQKTEAIMEKMDARCVDEDEKEEIRAVVKSGNRLIIIYFVIYFSYTTSTFLSAVFMGRPPYSVFIPFVNWRHSTWEFVLATTIEYGLMDVACVQQTVDDAYAVVYINILRTHMKILMLRIRKLGTDPTKSKKENTEELIQCIIDHKNIMDFYNIIHPIISTTIFIQFLITGVILGTTLINILIFADFSSIIASLFYILAIVVETMPCCYYANCLMVESDQFGNNIFHSNWIEQEMQYRQMLIFFIQRSQKTITFTAGKLIPITLNSFLSIAKLSFSVYTLLSGMDYGNKK